MKHNKQGLLAVLVAILFVLALVLTFNPGLLRVDMFGLYKVPGDFGFGQDTPEDEGGDGFEVGDNCGFVMGDADSYGGENVLREGLGGSGEVRFGFLPDEDQGCVDENGYFYDDGTQQSRAYHTVYGTMDFTWSNDSSNHVHVDTVTGDWSGYARFTANGLDPGNRWVWFDWDCPDRVPEVRCASFRVQTDTETGAITGYAWNDYYGWLLFDGLTMELPPATVTAYVEVESLDGYSTSEVVLDTAPLADGYEYWRVKLTFVDNLTGETLTEDDVD